jgi:hypothetical protein
MAKPKATTAGGFGSFGAGSKPKVKPKATAAGGLSVSGGAPKPVLDSSYKFVFDPSGRESDEVKALKVLFADRTGGGDLLAQPDPQEALKSAGLIKGGGGRGLARGSSSNVYSSAQDAIDALGSWMDKNPPPVKDGLIGFGPGLIKSVADGLDEGFDLYKRGVLEKNPELKKASGGVPVSGLLDAYRRRVLEKNPELKTDVGGPSVSGALDFYRRRVLEKNPKLKGDVGGPTISQIPALRPGIGSIDPEVRKELDVRADVGPFSLYNVKGDTLGGIASGENRRIGLFNRSGPLAKPTRVSVDEATPLIENIIDYNLKNNVPEEEIQKQLVLLDDAQKGAPTADLKFTAGLLDLGPLSKPVRKYLVDFARSQGRDIALPAKYTDEELLHMAFTRASGIAEAQQSAARQVGELSAVIPGIVAIGKTIASGDQEQMVGLLKSVAAPYQYLVDDIGKRGWKPALTSFAQERPLDAILIANGFVRIAGRGAGAAVRTAGGTGTSLPQLLINATPEPGSLRARFGKFAAVNRPISVKLPEVRVGDSRVPEVDRSLVVGYTGKNLASTALSELFFRTVGRSTGKSGGSVSGGIARVAAGRTKRGMRRAQNVGDDAAVRATIALDDLSKGLSRDQVLRLALELVHATEKPDGSKFSLGEIADYWEGRTAKALQEIADGADNPTQIKANAARYSKQAQFFREAANTKLDQSFIDNAREAVRPLGDDNDTIVSLLFGAFDSDTNPSGLRTVPSKVAELEVGHKIDIGPEGEVIPARVTSVEVLPDGTRRVTRQNILDPRDVNSFVDLGARPITRLEPGVNSAKFVRQFIYWQEEMALAAKTVADERNAVLRADAEAVNTPRIRFNKLNAQREAAAGRITIVLDKMRAAESSGALGKVRKFRKQYERQVSKLILVLRDMEEQAILMGDEALARNIRAARTNVVKQRGVGGRVPLSSDAGLDPKLLVPSDDLAAQQARVAGSAEQFTFTPSALGEVRQVSARDALNRAAGLEGRAASLQERIDAAAAQRADAPVSAAQASRAAAELPQVRDRVVAASEAAVRAGDISAEFGAALNSIIARFDFLNGDTIFAKDRADKTRRLFAAASATDRAFVLSTLGDLLRLVEDRKNATDPANPPALLSADEVALLRSAETVLARMEQRAARYSAFRPFAAPVGFGGREAVNAIPDITEAQAAARAPGVAALERGGVLQERIAARRAVPSVKQLAVMAREKKRLLAEADKSRREARRIVERGMPLVRTESITAALDATTGEIAVKIALDKPVYFTPKQILNESRAEYIARVELYGNDPVLWVGTRAGVFGGQKAKVNVASALDVSPTAGIPSSRLKPLTGAITQSGTEDMRNIWRNLIADTGTIRGALAMQREMRMLIQGVSIRITNVTEREAAAMNRAASGRIDDTIDLSEAEFVVWDSRDYVAVNPFDKDVRIRQQVQTGVASADDTADLTLADLFAREASEVDVIRANGDYYLIPRFLYNQMKAELASIDYQLGPKRQGLDAFTKQWRNFTLNIFPRTGFANLVGSAALAALAGAGPKSFYLAYRHLRYGDVPAPAQLRQRFGATLTSEAEFAKARDALNALYPGADRPLGALAWWMNHMRQFNGISEDFGRLAVWYSKAYPEASRLAGDSFVAQWGKMRTVSEGASDLLERFANNDPDFAAQAAKFTDLAFEWVGDLHAGGALNANLRIAIPFQQWYRHVLRLTLVTMPVKYPGRTLFLYNVAEIGKDYLHQHGILPSWFDDLIPILIEEKMVDGVPQEYVTAWRTANLNVFSATSDAVGSNGQIQWADYGANTLLPIWGSAAQLIFSFLSGESQQFGYNSINTDVKNQYGQVIPFFSAESANYSINQLIRGLPMSTIAASTSARAPESNIFFGNERKPIRGDGFAWSEDVLPPDAPGRDFLSVGKNAYNAAFNEQEFNYASPAALMLRLFIGGGAAVVLGKGAVRDSQIYATYARLESKYKRNEQIEWQKKWDAQQASLEAIDGK